MSLSRMNDDGSQRLTFTPWPCPVWCERHARIDMGSWDHLMEFGDAAADAAAVVRLSQEEQLLTPDHPGDHGEWRRHDVRVSFDAGGFDAVTLSPAEAKSLGDALGKLSGEQVLTLARLLSAAGAAGIANGGVGECRSICEACADARSPQDCDARW